MGMAAQPEHGWIANLPYEFVGGYLVAGVGEMLPLYLVVAYQGENYLCRGRVFSYYEFLSATPTMTDKQWQERLKRLEIPTSPLYQRSYIISINE